MTSPVWKAVKDDELEVSAPARRRRFTVEQVTRIVQGAT
jgi:hypothetical protein